MHMLNMKLHLLSVLHQHFLCLETDFASIFLFLRLSFGISDSFDCQKKNPKDYI